MVIPGSAPVRDRTADAAPMVTTIATSEKAAATSF